MTRLVAKPSDDAMLRVRWQRAQQELDQLVEDATDIIRRDIGSPLALAQAVKELAAGVRELAKIHRSVMRIVRSKLADSEDA